MLLKFAFQDILADRRFKNTMKMNIRNYQSVFTVDVPIIIKKMGTVEKKNFKRILAVFLRISEKMMQ